VVKKRDINEDERALWVEVTRDVRRAARAARPSKEPKRQPQVVLREQPAAKLAPPVQALQPKARRGSAGLPGVDGATAERLRRGRIEPDARLDLHGMTQQQAHGRLVTFVRRGHEAGYRCLLVITGKGAAARPGTHETTRAFVMPERSKAGVLRSLVPLWLEQAETRSMVGGIHTAHQRHGGGGAYYVYLRRKTSRGT